MHTELTAAVTYLRSLVEQSETCSWGNSEEALQAFSNHLYSSLASRSSISSWNEQEPEIGSAARVVHWQVQAGGEGADEDVVESCWKGFERSNGRKVLGKNKKQAAVEVLSTSFTLWLDPGCVAVRTGPGPGLRSNPSLQTNVNEWETVNGVINVIWGNLPLLASVQSSRPNVTLSEVASPALSSFSNSSSNSPRLAQSRRPCAIAIIDPASQAYLGLGRPPYAPSPLSACSTSSGSSMWSATSSDSILSRSTSLSSASSANTSEGGWSPRLVEATLDEKDGKMGNEKDGTEGEPLPSPLPSIGDETEGDVTIKDSEEGDKTILSSSPEKKSHSTAASLAKLAEEARISNARNDAPTRVVPAPAAGVKEARLYDNGKVGVLGGGVKLGGGPPKPSTNRPVRPTHSHSQSQAQYQPQSQQASGRTPLGRSSVVNHHYQPQPHQYLQSNPHHQNLGSQSAPSHNVPLPQVATYQQHQQQNNHHQYQRQQILQEQQQREVALHNHLYALSLEHQQRNENRSENFPTLPAPHNFHPSQSGSYQGQALASNQVGSHPMSASSSYSSNLSSASSDCSSSVSGNEYGSEYSLTDSRRSKSRGRRSRGRGAGRAARRQAAAMRALEENEAQCLDLDLDEFDFDDEEEQENEVNGRKATSIGKQVFSTPSDWIHSKGPSSFIQESPASSGGGTLSSYSGSLNSTPSSCLSQTVPLPFSSPNDFDRLSQSSDVFSSNNQTSVQLQYLGGSMNQQYESHQKQSIYQPSNFYSNGAAVGGSSLGLEGLDEAWDGATPRQIHVATF